MLTCRHCQQRKVSRPRCLCRKCYHTPEVRALYSSIPPVFGTARAIPDFNGSAPLSASPTAAVPGSEKKIAVLAGRAARGETLWHPQDGRGANG